MAMNTTSKDNKAGTAVLVGFRDKEDVIQEKLGY
jgi:hypothetical protein